MATEILVSHRDSLTCLLGQTGAFSGYFLLASWFL